jgi:hypothetical protein
MEQHFIRDIYEKHAKSIYDIDESGDPEQIRRVVDELFKRETFCYK